MYKLRMDLSKQASENMKQEQIIREYKEKSSQTAKVIESMREREKQYQSIQNDLEKYLDMLSQVDRYLKTLIKFLKNVVDKSDDPQIIEHT